jgi:hypothetical protein
MALDEKSSRRRGFRTLGVPEVVEAGTEQMASDAKEPMWPPRSPPSAGWWRLALTTMAMAFQRM